MKLTDIFRKLISNILRQIHGNIRLCLSHDAAYVLTPVHLCRIFTSIYIAGLSSYNTAYIITDMLISDRALIHALLDDPCRTPRNTAGVDRIIGGSSLNTAVLLLRARQLQQAVRILPEINVLKRHPFIFIRGIHLCPVRAACDITVIFTRNTSCIVDARHVSGAAAAKEHSAQLIISGNSSHIIVSRNTSVKAAVQKDARIFTHDTAYRKLFARGLDNTCYIQICNDRCLSGVAEQTGIGNTVIDRQTTDRMTLSVKISAKGRNRGKAASCHVKILGKINLLIAGPCI